jgi:hypothetical protein
MTHAPLAVCTLLLAAAGCAPSTQLESPADPPGIEKEDERAVANAEPEPEPEPEPELAEPDSESFE